jgi:hypothetical protein
MSRIEIPVARQILWNTGDVKLWVNVDLLLKDNAGNFVPETFRLDCGTEITTFPAYWAKQFDLPMPSSPSVGTVHIPTGLEIRSGTLRFRIDGMDPTEYYVACFFLGDPDTAPDPRAIATFPRKLLQPFSLLDRLRFLMDHDPASAMLYGHVIVEQK